MLSLTTMAIVVLLVLENNLKKGKAYYTIIHDYKHPP